MIKDAMALINCSKFDREFANKVIGDKTLAGPGYRDKNRARMFQKFRSHIQAPLRILNSTGNNALFKS